MQKKTVLNLNENLKKYIQKVNWENELEIPCIRELFN